MLDIWVRAFECLDNVLMCKDEEELEKVINKIREFYRILKPVCKEGE